ncbi:MAG: hypothetical protein HYY00_01410 [Chloroflexi bacterium]|nr:hypothetical protein [Chloroflexota bacterium]
MPAAEEMKKVVQEIIGAYDTRAAEGASLRGQVSDQRQAAQSQLHQMARAHLTMAKEQRADLTREHTHLTRAGAQRRADVGAWMKQVTTDHREARAAWQQMGCTLREKRGGASALAAAPVLEAPEITPRSRKG